MTHEEAFLADILETPDDDTPRLIFADWLEDNGDPDRAEFIRVRIAHARIDDPSRRVSYLQRGVELLERNWDRWVVPLAKLVGPEPNEPWMTVQRPEVVGPVVFLFERGFLSRLAVSATTFLSRGEEILRLAPVTHLRLRGARRRGAALAVCASLRYVRRLEFLDPRTSSLDRRDLEALAASPHLGRLRGLNLCGHRFGDEGLYALLETNWVMDPFALELGDNGCSIEAYHSFLRTVRRRHLRLLWPDRELSPRDEEELLALGLSPRELHGYETGRTSEWLQHALARVRWSDVGDQFDRPCSHGG